LVSMASDSLASLVPSLLARDPLDVMELLQRLIGCSFVL
jgi:hypothetical protein